MLTLNETPVRTAKNFNINNIKIDDINLPNRIENFENIEVNIPEGAFADNNPSKVNLKYGVGEGMENEINDKSNNSLKIVISEKMNEPITIFCEFDEGNSALIQNIEIIAKEGSYANFIIKYKSQDENECYHNSTIRIKAEQNANVHMTIVNLLNTESTNFLSIENELGENAILNYIVIDFGGKRSITNYYSNLIRKQFKKQYRYNIFRKK